MRRSAPRLTASAYVVLGALGVHAGRYLLVADHESDAGHGYLGLAPPVLVALLALGAARLLVAAAQPSPARRAPRGWRARWSLGWLAFVGLYAVQENLETLVSEGHAAGPLALLGHGGWTVLPLAALAAGVLAALLRGTEAVLARAQRLWTGLSLSLRPRTVAETASVRIVLLWPGAPELARHFAERAPPARS